MSPMERSSLPTSNLSARLPDLLLYEVLRTEAVGKQDSVTKEGLNKPPSNGRPNLF